MFSFSNVKKLVALVRGFKEAFVTLNWDKIGDYAKDIAEIVGYPPQGEALNNLLDAIGVKDYIAAVNAAAKFITLIMAEFLVPIKFGLATLAGPEAVLDEALSSLESQCEDDATQEIIPLTSEPQQINPILVVKVLALLVQFFLSRK